MGDMGRHGHALTWGWTCLGVRTCLEGLLWPMSQWTRGRAGLQALALYAFSSACKQRLRAPRKQRKRPLKTMPGLEPVLFSSTGPSKPSTDQGLPKPLAAWAHGPRPALPG